MSDAKLQKTTINPRLLIFSSSITGGEHVDWITRLLYMLSLRSWRRKYRYELED
jgi:hypothetical protein